MLNKGLPNESVDGWTLIVGSRREFCLTVYAALLDRFPDLDAIWHFDRVPVEVDARVREIRLVMASTEFASNGRVCVFGERPEVTDLHDLDLRLSNFLAYSLPAMMKAFMQHQELNASKSSEIGDLIREILVEMYSEPRMGHAATHVRAGNESDERVNAALHQEIEALRTFVHWELPKRILRQVNYLIMANAAETERQFRNYKG